MDKILIKNGLIYDPLSKEKSVRDLALAEGRIVSATGTDSGAGFTPSLAIDASGCIVVPGLIDFHVHGLTSVSEIAVTPDISCLPNGVTACVGGWTAGSANFEAAYNYTISSSVATIKAALHFCPAGQVTGKYPENQNPAFWDRDAIKSLVKKYPGVIMYSQSDFIK
jgi:dihydroorotase